MFSGQQPPVVATIAGSDTGGAAGLAADLKSFAAFGVHGVYALTMLTAQNTTGISSVQVLDAAFIAAQLDALLADYDLAATKTGLLFSEQAVAEVVTRANALGSLVVDPVLVRSSGTPLVAPEVVQRYQKDLIPLADLITPNVAEASLLSGVEVDSVHTALIAANMLRERGAQAVVVTGVSEGARMADVLVDGDGDTVLRHAAIDTPNVLGTGCSFSASVASNLALGNGLAVSVEAARDFVHAGVRSGAKWRLGAGQGPIDHMARFRP